MAKSGTKPKSRAPQSATNRKKLVFQPKRNRQRKATLNSKQQSNESPLSRPIGRNENEPLSLSLGISLADIFRSGRNRLSSILTKPEAQTNKLSEERTEIPEQMEIPQTLIGLILLRLFEMLDDWKGFFKSRLEVWKRTRRKNGPGTIEIIFREFVLAPSSTASVAILDYSRSYFRVNDAFAKSKHLPWSGPETHPNTPTWHQLESNQQKVQTFAAFTSFVSILLGISIHELQFRGYIPLWSEDCANPMVDKFECIVNPCAYIGEGNGVPTSLQCARPYPNESIANTLKILNSSLTAWLIITIYIYYRYQANILSLRNHVEFNQKLTKHDLHSFRLLGNFMLEVLICTVHQVPYFNIDLTLDTRAFSSRIAVHTLDGILSLFIMLRLYHLWRWYRGSLFALYTGRNFIARLNHQSAGTALALRILILDSPITAAFQFAMVVIFVGSYLFRVAEASINISASRYYWDSLSFVADTFFGAGAFDPAQAPQSAFGRVITIIVRFLGILWLSILVSSCRQYSKYNHSELITVRWLQMSRMANIHQHLAARCIQRAWRFGVRSWRVARQIRRFQASKIECRKFEEQNNLLESANFEMFLKIAAFRQSRIARQVEEKFQSLKSAQQLDPLIPDTSPDNAASRRKNKTGKKSGHVIFGTGSTSATGEIKVGTRVAINGKMFGDEFHVQSSTSAAMMADQTRIRSLGHNFGSVRDSDSVDESLIAEAVPVSSDDSAPTEVERREIPQYSKSAAVPLQLKTSGTGPTKPLLRRGSTEMSSKDLTKFINFDLVLDKKEKALLDVSKQKQRSRELSSSLQQLIYSNDILLRSLGHEPIRYEPPSVVNLEAEKPLEDWEKSWNVRLDKVAQKIVSMDEALTGAFGQIFLLIEGLYNKKGESNVQ